MPTRPTNSTSAVRVGPLNVDGVLQIEVDLSGVGAVLDYSVDESDLDSALAIGDGSTSVTTPAGTMTPASPTLSSDVVVFSVFQANGETLIVGKDYAATLHYRTAAVASSVTVVFPVVSDR